MTATTIEADWLTTPALQTLLATLSADGEEARVVGGAVRNSVLDQAVTDIDVATTTLPQETVRRVEAAGFRAVPTGIEHGTVTVVTTERAYEVTTLRRDIETDGRRAIVHFGRDWQADAERRDFTINALYARADGSIVDLVGGRADLDSRTLRFIGDSETRIREDYLRILRFFRFFAWYGEGRPDAAGIRAATRLKEGLDGLSAERVWTELKKLLAAPNPSRALLWMRQTGVLTRILPESERWGIDAIHSLVESERAFGWSADPMLRLAAIVPPDAARLTQMAERLKLSNADRNRIVGFAVAEPAKPEESDSAFRARLYFGDRAAITDRLRLGVAAARAKAGASAETLEAMAQLTGQLDVARNFAPPAFPVSGDDLKSAGISPGPEMGRTLDRLRRLWASSGFVLGRDSLLERV
ncbi:CCA tRNA nucleotidyltransferase [Aurantimonas sp. A2-1-M11]|uniref:CCA tRNA nucleotidyltransferase n=1 Tax=Aurantimonas sp. A2-1-M11 TaxID=3113712 RepID=UPI002F941503